MSNFDELLGKLKNADEENPLPEDYHEQLETAYLQSLETRDEKIRSLETEKAELDGKVKEYAVQNYDLMRKTPVEEQQEEPPQRQSTGTLVSRMLGKK